ncbi:MAG: hypothetical protein WDN46_19100 [Methylocella sp.]
MSRTIIDELNDPALFAPHFKGDSWDGWKAFLAALFGLPLSEGPARGLSGLYGPLRGSDVPIL